MEGWPVTDQAIMEVQLGELGIAGATAPTHYYDRPILAELKDWFAPGESRSETGKSTLSHGGYWTGPQLVNTKTLAISGWVASKDRLRIDQLKRELAALISKESHDLAVTTEFNRTHRQVRVLHVDLPDDHGGALAKWSIDCEAEDPRRYGDVEVQSIDFNDDTRVSNIITNPRPSMARHWFTSTMAGESKPATSGGGFVYGKSGSEYHVCVYYRGPLTGPVDQVRLEAAATQRVRGRITCSWLNADGVAIRTDAFPDTELSRDWTRLATPVSPPPGAVEFTLGVDTFGSSGSESYDLRVRRAMAGKFGEGATLYYLGGYTEMARMVGDVCEGDSRNGRIAITAHDLSVGRSHHGHTDRSRVGGSSISCQVRASHPGVFVAASVSWLDLHGDVINQVTFDQIVVGPEWRRLSTVLVPPRGAMSMSVAVDALDNPDGTEDYTLSVRGLVEGGADSDYHDGDSPGWHWNGARGDSTSSQTGPQWVLDNRDGTAPSLPTISFTPAGTLSGFRLSAGHGHELRWVGQIPAKAKVELIPGEHAVMINGKLAKAVARGEWPVVKAGECITVTLVPTESVKFSAECRWSAAWW